jgi:AAA domain
MTIETPGPGSVPLGAQGLLNGSAGLAPNAGSPAYGPLTALRSSSIPVPKKLDGMRAIDFLALTFPAVQERIEGLAPLEGFGAFVGADKSGKSLSLSQLAICLSSGKSWMDAAVVQCPVILIEEEGAKHSLQSRLARQVKQLGLIGVDLPLFVYHRTMLKLQEVGWIDALEKDIIATGAKVVLISSLAQVGGIEEENDQREFNAIHDALRGLIDRTHVLVIIAHHRRKPAKDGKSKSVDAFFNSSRGSSALMAAVDLAFGLERGSEDPTGRMFYKGRDFPSHSWGVAFESVGLTFDLDWSAPALKPDMEKAAILAILESKRGSRLKLGELVTATGLPRTTLQNRCVELAAEGKCLAAQHGAGPKAPFEYWVDDPTAMRSAALAAAAAAYP